MIFRYRLITAALLLLGFPASLSAADGDLKESEHQARHRYHHFELFHKKFVQARDFSPREAESAYWRLLGEGEWFLTEIRSAEKTPPLDFFGRLEEIAIEMAAAASAREEHFAGASRFLGEVRLALKESSRRWPRDDGKLASALYSCLYGVRTALEEALLQLNRKRNNPLALIREVPSAAPHARVKGVKVHSGDILLTRGDNAVASLVARGSSRPGIYSGASIVHLEAGSGAATVIGAEMGGGVWKKNFGDFLAEKNYDALLLRVAPDHSALEKNPLAAARAADYALSVVEKNPLYDTRLDWRDDSRLYGEELLLAAFKREGIELWPFRGVPGSPGLAAWLHSLGVRNLSLLVPSDLEYEPGLALVAEWRNIEQIRQERIKNALYDALTAGAGMGDRLGYPMDEAPLALLVKGWSVVQFYRGKESKIPDGMGALDALRYRAFTGRVYPHFEKNLRGAAVWLNKKQGFEPTFWQLAGLAKKTIATHRDELGGLLKSLAAK